MIQIAYRFSSSKFITQVYSVNWSLERIVSWHNNLANKSSIIFDTCTESGCWLHKEGYSPSSSNHWAKQERSWE